MAGTLKKLKRLRSRLKGEVDSSVVVPFEVLCDCGEVVRGIRRDTWIQSECSHCGQTLFILAANVYPSTKLVPSEILGGTFSDRLQIVAAEFIPRRQVKHPQPFANNTAQPEVTTVAEPEVAVPSKVKLSLPRVDVKKAVKRTFTPFRVLMLGMAAVLVLTGFWISHKNAIESAQQTWLKSTDEITEYLSDGKFVELEAALKQAVRAGATLGKSDSEWRSTVNLCQEISAVNMMASGDLLSEFHKAYDEFGDLVADARESILSVTQTGAFVVDSYFRRDDLNEGSFLIDMPAAPGRHLVNASIELPLLNRYLEAHTDGRILFAAKVVAVTAPIVEGRSESASDVWVLELDPQSFVLLTSKTLMANVGMPVEYDSELADILARQDEFVRASETWGGRVDDVVETRVFEQSTE